MEDFQGNSLASRKDRPIDDEQKPKVQPVTSNVKVKKETELKKFGKQFFSEDATTVKKQIFSQVFVPGLQKIISDIIKNGIDWLLYGVRGGSSTSSGAGRVSYSNYYDRRPATPQQPSGNRSSVFSVNEVIFSDRGECEEVLINLREQIDRYGMVSVSDFYDLINKPHSFTDCKYGWRDLREADVERVRDGFSIRFPKVIPLE